MQDGLEAMAPCHHRLVLDHGDYLLAVIVGASALAAYIRTLAPDVLYGDSAEFQTLAYTLGMTHSTGYPVYLVLGRLLGYLPMGSPAWRINLLSALGAAVTVGGVFLLARCLTRDRAGALLASLALGVSYTFWSQAVIAEVYTPAMAFLTLIVLLLWRWTSAPAGSNRTLFFAALLVGLSVGVHASAVLVAPVATAFAAWGLWRRGPTWPQRWRGLGVACLGLAAGLGACLLAFIVIDLHNTPTSFYQVMLIPSRSIWRLGLADLDSPVERLALTLLGRQWRDAMFPGGVVVWDGLKYGRRLLGHEFAAATLLCALLGLVVTVRRAPRLGAFVALALATMLLLIVNYEPPDKYVFYLPTYVFVAVAAGAGASFLLQLVYRHLVVARGGRYLPIYVLALGLLCLAMVGPYAASRWRALQARTATFVGERYAYPQYDLHEPRRVAARRLAQLAPHAVLIADWRALYATLYLAHVEMGRKDVRVMEAAPHGSDGRLAETLVEELVSALRAGQPVYADQLYGDLERHFRARKVAGCDLYRLSLP